MRCDLHTAGLSSFVSLLPTLIGLTLTGPIGCGDSASHAKPSGPKAVTVGVLTVQPRELRDVVALSGQLEAEYSVVVKPELSGIIASIELVEGQEVAEGDVLVVLRDGEQRARLAEALAQQRLAQDVYDRQQQLARQNVAAAARRFEAAAELDEAKARVAVFQLELDQTRVRAPFRGTTGARMVAPGDRITPDTGIVSVSALDRLQLLFTVTENSVSLARLGAPISARVGAWPGEGFPGEVYFISPTVDPATRRLLLKAWVPNAEHKLKPGMFANVDVEIAYRQEALLVPESALVYDRHGVYLWRLAEEEAAEKIPVEIGVRQQGEVEIIAGISPGDSVVVTGTNKVKAGSRIRRSSEVTVRPAGSTLVAEPPTDEKTGAGGDET